MAHVPGTMLKHQSKHIIKHTQGCVKLKFYYLGKLPITPWICADLHIGPKLLKCFNLVPTNL